MSRHRRLSYNSVVDHRLFTGFCTGLPFLRRREVRLSPWRHVGAECRLLVLGLAQRLRHVPTDVCHHYTRPHRRVCGGADKVIRRLSLRRALDVLCLFPASPHDLGNRWAHERRVESQCADHCH